MDPKFLRKQIRNVLQENAEIILKAEVGQGVKKELLEFLHKRLETLEKNVQTFMADQDKRARAIQGFIIGEVKNNIQNDIFDNKVTVQAAVEVLNEAGLGIENFGEKVKARKPQIVQALQEHAAKEMEEQIKAKADAALAKKEAAPPAEPVAEPASEAAPQS